MTNPQNEYRHPTLVAGIQEYYSVSPPDAGLDAAPVFQARVQKGEPSGNGNFWTGVLLGAGSALASLARKASGAKLPMSTQPVASTREISVFENPAQYIKVPREAMLVKTHRVETDNRFGNTTQDALGKLAKKEEKRNERLQEMRRKHAQTIRLLNKAANEKGLPDYEQFHRDHGIPYTHSVDAGFGLSRAEPKPSRPEFIAEAPIDPSLGQKPLTLREQMLARQANLFAREAEAARQAQLEEQRQAERARRQARELRQYYKDQRNGLNPEKPNLLKGQISQSTAPSSVDLRPFEYKGENLWLKLHRGEVLDDLQLKQLFHNLELQKHTAETQAEQFQAEALRQHIEQKFTENIVAQSPRDTDGNVLLFGIPVRPEDAAYFVKQDLQHFQQTDRHLRPDEIVATTKNQTTKPARVRLLYVDAAGAFYIPGRIFGHTALEVDGQVYNLYPNGGVAKMPAQKYIESVTNKSVRKSFPQNIYAYPIKMTDSEISLLKSELAKKQEKWDLKDNTCAIFVMRSLEKATEKSKEPIKGNPYAASIFPILTPSDVVDSLKKSRRVEIKPTIYPIHSNDPKQKYHIWGWNWGLK